MGKKVIRGGLIIKATLASGSGDDLLTIDATTGEVGKISGTPLTTTLTAGSIFLGNASNVATATAMSGDVTINSSGVTAIGAGVIVNADVNASAAIAHSKMAALTASRALVSDGSGVVSVSSVTSTELGYVSGVTSAIQAQINGKQATITGAATTITSSDLTANRALLSNASGKVAVSSVTNTELGYLSGVTSAIQTQFSGKLSATITGAAEGDIIYHNGTTWVNLPRGANGETLQSTGSSIQWASATANGIPAGGDQHQVLHKASGTDYDTEWHTLTLSDIGDVTASADELNLLDGVTATTAEINYLDGVTSNIQSQFGNKLSSSLPHNAIFVGNISNIAASLAAGSEGQVLTISSGTPTWTTVSTSGVTTIAAIDGTTKSANGGAISGANLYFQTADDTYPGLVSTGTQTFTGAKTFSGSGSTVVTINAASAGEAALNLTENNSSSAGTYWQLFKSTTHYLGFYNGSTRMAITAAGNVGIGTSSPNAPLQFGNTLVNRKVVLYESGNNDHNFMGFGAEGAGVRYQTSVGGDHTFYVGTSSTTSDELMRITGGGKVGIGTTPTAKLHLPAGTATANTAPLKFTTGTALTSAEDGAMEYHSSHLYFTIGSTRYQLDGLIGSTGSTDNAILRADGAGGLTAQNSSAIINDSGHLGLGGSPSYTLDAITGTNPTVAARTTGTGAPGVYIQRTGGTASAAYLYLPTGSDSLRLQQNGTDYFHFTNGKLGIGANPTHTLDIQESAAGGLTARILNTSTGPVQLVLDRSGGTAGGWSIVRPSGSTSLVFNDGSADEFEFATDGTATGTDWVATSDARLKTNISRIDTDVLEKIIKIGEIVSEYDRIDNGKHEMGFIAQELQKIAPEYVVEGDTLAINYAKMSALLFKGFQQLLNK